MLIVPPPSPPFRLTPVALGEGVVDERASRCRELDAVGRKLGVEPEPHVLSTAGHLEEHVVRLRTGLAKLQIRGTQLVRRCTARQGGEQQAKSHDDSSHRSMDTRYFFCSPR